MKLKKKNFTREKWFAYTVATCSAVLLFVVLSNIGIILDGARGILKVLSPVIEGIVIAYMMHPVCELFYNKIYYRISSRKIARSASVATGALVVLFVLVVLIVALIPQIIESIATFISNMSSYAMEVTKLMGSTASFAEERGIDISSVVASGNEFVENLIISIPRRFNGFVTASYNFGVSIANLLIAFILAIYFLLAEEHLLQGIDKLARALMSPKRYQASAQFWSRCNTILIRYITYDIVDGFIVGFCNFVFMLVFSMPYSVLISVIVGVTNLAPTFGPIVGGVIGAFILALANPLDAVIFVLFTVIIQVIDGYILKPRLFGTSLGVPPVWILVTIIVGGNIFGVLGILLAIPFAAIMTYVYREFLEKRIDEEGKKQIAREKEETEETEAADA